MSAGPAFLVVALGRAVREDVETALREHGIALRHVSALGHLGHAPGLSYSELARRAGVTAQSMQATLRQLEDRGAVVRRTPGGRGRVAELHVTAAGAELLATARAVFADVDRAVFGDLPPERRAELTSALLAAARRRL